MLPLPSQPSPPHSFKKYYNISEAARLLNVSTSLIRFWEKKFPTLRPKKSDLGIRKYTAADLAMLRRIYALVKEQGYTLAGAKEALKQSSNLPPHSSHAAIVATLKELRAFLVALQEA